MSSPNTVVKWSVALKAAFNRVNKNSTTCVRSVVSANKLLSENPWQQFTWIEGRDKPIRQFDSEELLSLLDYLDKKWRGVTIATAFAKFCLWSWGRRDEVSSLKWENLRIVGGSEYHFHMVGKWAVEKWVRIPVSLYQELASFRCERARSKLKCKLAAVVGEWKRPSLGV